MIYIKLDDSMNLVITVNEPIYRGDNLNQKIIYLIPLQVGEIDMLTATPYLSYIRADGVADIVRLERQSEKYKEAYPATLRDVSSVQDVNGMNAEVKTAFTKTVVSVEGANGYQAIDYKVYVFDMANANDTANTYKVTI